MSFMALLRVRNRENNEERLTQSSTSETWKMYEEISGLAVFVLFPFFMPSVLSLLRCHWPQASGLRLRVIRWCVNARPRHWGLAKTIRLHPEREPRPGPFLASSNKVFVPVRNWFSPVLTMLHQIIDGWYFNFRQTFSRAARPFVEHL